MQPPKRKSLVEILKFRLRQTHKIEVRLDSGRDYEVTWCGN